MKRIIILEETDSTNNYAIKNFDLLPDKTLVRSRTQTGGKGRRQSSWFSPTDLNLYASYVLKMDRPFSSTLPRQTEDLGHTAPSPSPFNIVKASWIGGVAALHTLREYALQEELWIKWPNDIFYQDKKISGVLCETVSDLHNRVKGLIIGIGINVNMGSVELKKIEKKATSLLAETGKEFSINDVAETLLKHLDIVTTEAMENIDNLYYHWKKENKLLGRTVTIEVTGNQTLTGKVVEIKPEGELYVVDKEGEFYTVYSGDVSIKAF